MMSNKTKWKKGSGEYISFAIIGIIICSLVIQIAAFLQLSYYERELSKTASVAARSAAVCTSYDDAEKQIQNIAENTLGLQTDAENISTKLEYAPGTKSWTSGGFIVVTVSAYIKTVEPYFTSGERSKKILVGIEGMKGNTVLIPEPYGKGLMTYTYWDKVNWSVGTDCWHIYQEWMKQPEENKWNDYIATYNGYYLIACTETFGTVGDIISFTLDDGTNITGIMADTKRTTDAKANQYGHEYGSRVIEFEIAKDTPASKGHLIYGGINNQMWKKDYEGKRVVSGRNLGKYPGFNF